MGSMEGPQSVGFILGAVGPTVHLCGGWPPGGRSQGSIHLCPPHPVLEEELLSAGTCLHEFGPEV